MTASRFPAKETIIIGVPCASLLFLLFSSMNYSNESAMVVFVPVVALFIILAVISIIKFRIGLISGIAFSLLTLGNIFLIIAGTEHGFRSFGAGMANMMWSLYIFFPFFLVWFVVMTILGKTRQSDAAPSPAGYEARQELYMADYRKEK